MDALGSFFKSVCRPSSRPTGLSGDKAEEGGGGEELCQCVVVMVENLSYCLLAAFPEHSEEELQESRLLVSVLRALAALFSFLYSAFPGSRARRAAQESVPAVLSALLPCLSVLRARLLEAGGALHGVTTARLLQHSLQLVGTLFEVLSPGESSGRPAHVICFLLHFSDACLSASHRGAEASLARAPSSKSLQGKWDVK